MNVFVAGGSGTIGIPLVRALVAAGHQVTALTRSTSKQDELRALGAVGGRCRRAESRGADRGRRGRASDPRHSSIDRAAEGRAAPCERSGARRTACASTARAICWTQRFSAGARRFVVGSFALLSLEGAAGTGARRCRGRGRSIDGDARCSKRRRAARSKASFFATACSTVSRRHRPPR